MTRKQALALSGRSETWLRRHECVWCGQTLWRALVNGCGAIWDRCDPTKKDFAPSTLRVAKKRGGRRNEPRPGR
jgi:hypothetical protein